MKELQLQETLLKYLKECGPKRGKELCDAFFEDRFSLWSACLTNPQITCVSVARHYLRLDKQLKDYARLSPSIWREFFSYTIVGHNSDEAIVKKKAIELKSEIVTISRQKAEIAKTICYLIYDKLSYNYPILKTSMFFLLAGDVVYEMAHRDPRPELSTGELVVGSDIDLVIIVSDNVEPKIKKLLEDQILEQKYRLINNPFHREEIDYVVKTESLLKTQMKMESFKDMVAMKVFCEGEFICGSKEYFDKISGAPELRLIRNRFKKMEEIASYKRKEVLKSLMGGTRPETSDVLQVFFYPAEESEEF